MNNKNMALIQRGIVDFMMAHALMTPQIEKRLRPLGLNLTQMSLLNHFSHQPDAQYTISQLAKVMEINQPGITKSVNALVGINCLEKKQDNDDARIKWLSITPVGLDKLNEARQLTGPFMFGAFGVIDPNQIESFCENLKKMKQYLDEQRV